MKEIASKSKRLNGSAKVLLGALILIVTTSAGLGQFTYSEDFKNSTAAGWVLNPPGNSTPNAILTSGAAPRTGDPEFGQSTIDSAGAGWLRLTNNTTNLANAVYFDTPIPSAGNSVNIQFGVNLWGGNNFNSTGADGITFFLYDASKSFQVGAFGGAIGYAQRQDTATGGLNGGYVGVALDPYGNFSVAGGPEGRLGGTGSLQPNSVVVRGPGQGMTGYNYLAGTGNRDYTDTGSATVLDGADGTVPALPYNMAYPTATSRPNQSTQYRNVSVTINENSQMFVNMQFGEDGLWYNLLNVDLSSFVRPEQLKMGFSAGTGSGTLISEVGGLLKIEATAGSGNFIWDNGEGAATKVWGTSATNPLNWAGNTNPTLKSNVIFNSTYVSSAQNIDVSGSDKVITNVYFSGPNAYTLGTTEARKLIFDSTTPGGLTTINLTNDATGNAAHAVTLDVQMNQNLDINNNITPTFSITGNIDTGGNVLGLKGAGTTVLAGALSGTGSLVKSDTGTTVLRGSSANTYSGTTTINGGTLQIEKASALGATSAGTTINSGGTLALAGAGTTFDAEALALSGTGVGGNGALRNTAGNNTWTGSVALAGVGNNAIGVDSATQLNVAGVISGSSGNNLLKVGSGTLALSGTNTFAGATIINAGTVKIGADVNLGAAPGAATPGHLSLDGGTLQTTNTFSLNANRGITLGAAGGTLNTDAGTTLTYNGIIAGSSGGALNKAGTGTLTLGSASTYNGATNINAGTLRLGVDHALPTTTGVTVAAGATFDLNSRNAQISSLAGSGQTTLGTGNILTVSGSANSTYSGIMSGSGGLTKAGSSILSLSGANTFTGDLRIDSGTIRLAGSNVFSDSSTLVLSGGTFSTNGFSDRFSSLSLLSTSTIDFNSLGGLLTFGTGSYTAGGLTIANWAGSPTGGGASRLLVDSATAFDTTFLGNITFSGYGTGAQIIAFGGGFELVPTTGASYTWGTDASGNWSNANWAGGVNNPGGTGTTAVFGDAITANRTVTLDANRTAGYLIFNDNNSYTLSGPATLTMDVSGGNAQINVSGGGSPTLSSAISLSDSLAINQNSSGGTLTISGGISGANRDVIVGGSDDVVISGVISTGSGTLTKNNPGKLTLSGANTFTGSTAINGGVVSISADNNLGLAPGSATAAHLALNGGTLQSTASFALSANRGIELGAGGGTLETAAATTLTYNGIIAGTSGGALQKTGAGTLSLGGASTYNGPTAILAGTVTITAAERLPNATAVTIASGATLNTNSFSETVGSLAGAGSLTLGSPGAATAFATGGDNSSTTFSGVISGGANAAFTKAGTGTLTLSGANTLAGNITVASGALNIQNSSALGTTAGRTTVNAGAALELQGGIAVGAEPLFLNGTGIATNGALRNVGGNNSFAGAITLQAAASLKSDADTLTLSGGVTGPGLGLTVTGAGNTTFTTAGINTGTGGSLIKSGTGTLTLAAAGNYTGATTINAGTVEVQNATALGTATLGTTVAGGATLALGGGAFSTAEALSLAGSGVGGSGALRNLDSDHTVSGNIALTAESYIGAAAATSLTASGVISGGFGLTKVDHGTLVLSGANSYSGTTAINAGTVQLSGAGTLGTAGSPTTISSGATLAVSSLSAASAENITVTGSGVAGAGAIQSIAGTNTINGNLTMTGDTTIGVSAGSLVAGGNLAGAYALVKTGAGNLTLAGSANSYSGSTTLRNGSLTVNTSAPVGASGALGNSGSTIQVGDTGTAATDNLALLIGNAGGGVSVARAISVNNFNPSGTSTLGGTNTSGTNTFAGNIGLGRDTTLSAAPGGTVNFSGILSGSGPVTAGSAGNTGTVVLSSANTYTGTTTVTQGTLVAAHANALGTNAGGTIVNSGGTLGLQGNITLPASEAITLSGSGAGGVGALSNVSGDNTVAANISLASATTVGAQAGSLTLSGGSSGSSALTTTGAGNLILAGTHAYTGATTVGGTGTVILNNSGGPALAGTSGVTVNSGATLSFGANNQILNTADLSLAGGTLLLNGFQTVLRNVSLAASTTSLVDYLNDGSLLRFTGSTAVGAAGTLTVDNWAGNPTTGGSGTYGLLFNTQAEALALENSVLFNGWSSLGNNNVIANGSYWEIVPIVTVREWLSTTGGNWDTGGSWTGGVAPDATGAIALLGNSITAGSSATLSTSGGANDTETVGKLIIDATGGRNYTVSGADRLDFDASGSTQLIVSGDGQHVISAPVRVVDDLTITNDGTTTGSALTISGTMDLRNGTASDLIVTGTGNTRISGVISSSNTAGATLLKTGSGTLTLDGANTFSGGTTLRNGTLVLNNANATGSAATIVINDASTTGAMDTSLLLGTSGLTLDKAITVNSQGATTTIGGAANLTAPTDSVTFSGAISLGKTVSLAANGSSVATFSGTLSGAGGIDKVGTGTVVLSGTSSNTFTGNVDVKEGTLQLAKSAGGVDAIGATRGAIGDLAAVSLSGASAVLSINGPAAQTLEEIGSLAGVAGANVNVAQATAFTLYTGANNASTTFAGSLTDTGGSLSLVKQGTGTMTLSGANAYDGSTLVSAGTLVAAHNTALGTTTGNTTVSAGATLGLQGGITVTGEGLSVAAATSPGSASVANLSGTNVWTGNIAMTGAIANDQVKFDAAGGSQLTLSGSVSEATNAKVLAKTGTGTLVLAGANTYTGSTNVAAGTLVVAHNNALGTTAAGTSVQIGATLGVQNNVTVASGESFNLYGTVAPPSAPSIKNITGTNTLQGNITLNGGLNTGVSIDANTGSLTLNGAITQAASPNYIIKTGSGDLTLGGSGSNTFSGGFTINDGNVFAAKTAGDATGAGSVIIGDGIGAAGSAGLRLSASNQINNTSAVTVQTDGRLDLQGFNDAVGALTLSGGNVQGTGTLTLGNTLTFNGVGSSTASISANLDLGTTGTRLVQVGNNGVSGDTDLNISGAIAGGSAGFNKTDLGTLQLSGTTANTFSGVLQISDGTVALNKTAGVNATGTGNITVGNSVGAANTASLKLLASEQINDTSSVTIMSDGKFDVAGVTETIAAFAGTGAIATGTGGSGLLIAGGTDANFTFSGSLSGDGTIRKVGAGTLTFDQSINFASGTLELNSGTLALAGSNNTFAVGTLHITGHTILDFGNSIATTLSATNVIIDAGVTLTITNWVHLQDYFFANGLFQQLFGPAANFDVRGVQPQNQVIFAGWNANDTTWQSWDRQITPAPEPATYGALMVGGALALLGYRRWRKQAKPTA